MKPRLMKAAVSGLLILLLAGCSFISDPVSLMTTPDLPADKATLMGAINSQKPENSNIIRPRSDSGPSSIRVEDLNNDGIMEAVVFYKTPNEEVQIHGMILQQQGNTWVKKLDFDGEGTMLESFDLIDITNNGTVDIVAGFSRGEEDLQNGLVVYTFSGDSLEKVLQLPYTHFEVTDLNGDGIKELTVVSLQKYELSFITTSQFDKETNSFKELAKLDLGQNVEKYYNIVSGEVAKGKEGIILDTAIVSNSSTSKLIVMEDGVLIDVMKEDGAYKELPVDSQDINGDGILEIGLIENPIGWDNNKLDEIPYFQSYYQWDGKTHMADEKKGLKFVMQRYQDTENQFYLTFPPEWHNKVTVHPDSDKSRYLNFIMVDSGKTVAEVKFFSLPEWERAKDEWKVLVRKNDQVIGYKGELKLIKNEKKNYSDVAPIERKGN
ncbi:hypothetical protein SAMN05661091_3344 [Paenibacillus uliginis N3/975]|uniref:Repeat domain-containing protein n=1 Tax=Paenibacillus uliginis N3/975 TaxID=1313296 RepID=A0A1X7HGE8_9BACL|nr:hypothetical protein [Paenibacillus uliginis]SMF86265.1 hypothetical protein SAMN05661091_3344 [Paenibacillus uliginis N3/975]